MPRLSVSGALGKKEAKIASDRQSKGQPLRAARGVKQDKVFYFFDDLNMLTMGTRDLGVSMKKDKVAGGAIALQLLHALVDVMVRHGGLMRNDLENIIARLNREAHSLGGTPAAAVAEASADTMRSWLLEAGDEPSKTTSPHLTLVKDDGPP